MNDTTTTTHRYVDVPVSRRDDADWGYGSGDGTRMHHFRRALVYADGTVTGWDEIAGYYRGDLPEEIADRARELASFSDADRARELASFSDADRAALEQERARTAAYLSAFARLGGVSSDPATNRARQKRAKKEARLALRESEVQS